MILKKETKGYKTLGFLLNFNKKVKSTDRGISAFLGGGIYDKRVYDST